MGVFVHHLLGRNLKGCTNVGHVLVVEETDEVEVNDLDPKFILVFPGVAREGLLEVDHEQVLILDVAVEQVEFVHVHDGTHDLLDHLLGCRGFPGAHVLVVLLVDKVALLDLLHDSVLHAVEEVHAVHDQDDVLVGVVPQDFDHFQESFLVSRVGTHLRELHCFDTEDGVILDSFYLLNFSLPSF